MIRASLLLGTVLAGFGALAVAQETPLISYLDTAPVNLSPPTFSTEAQAVKIAAGRLGRLTLGSEVSIQVGPDHFSSLEVVEESDYLNGDRMIRAQGWTGEVFYSLALTVGEKNLFGHFSSSQGIRQLYAIADDRDGLDFKGWLYQPASPANTANAFFNDYIIPEAGADSQGVSKPLTPTPTPLPLNNSVAPVAVTDVSNAVNATVNDSNFRISQQFSRDPVIAGGRVEARITFENISSDWHRGLSVEFFFLLENTELLLAPPQCQAQFSISLQEVLYCDLGDFAPGETRSITYIVATSVDTKPYILSTAIVGDLRVDSFVNVVDDVLLGSDGDGVSDFNESLLDTDPNNSESVNLESTTIDIMALYTAGAEALYPNGVETRINQLISVANQVYRDSGVQIVLRPVFHGRIDYNDADDMDTALNHLIYKSDPSFGNVDALRSAYGADLVMLFRPMESDIARCGLAPVGGFNTNGDFSAASERDFGYSYIAIDCPLDIVVAHELGHNMGLTHSHLEDGTGGTFDFSTGHGIESQFATVMAFPAAFNTDTQIALFSNPQLDCLGLPCGVDSSNEFGADAAMSLNIVRHQIGNYFPTTVPELPEHQISAISGIPTSASISMAASKDNGLSHSIQFSVADAVDLNALVRIDGKHIGENGIVNVLVGLGDRGFVQPDGLGNLVAWDGTIPGLLPVTGTGPLRAIERLHVLDDYAFDAGLVGQQIIIYVAYQLPEHNEIIYTINPLILNIVPEPSADIAISETAD